MIIIRPALLAKDSALFGVTCAVLGAAVGTVATWALQ
jgi:membrane protein YqaA with SNARE-associated domain